MKVISSSIGHVCVVVATSVCAIISPVRYSAFGYSAVAQDTSANSSSTSKSVAANLLNQIQTALQTMRQEFGPSVMMDGRGDLNSSAHGNETVAEAWKRNLIAAGVPKEFSKREALARSIGLDFASFSRSGRTRTHGWHRVSAISAAAHFSGPIGGSSHMTPLPKCGAPL